MDNHQKRYRNEKNEKISKKDRVISAIKKLDEEEQVNEVAKLISGEKITDKSISTAQELIALNRY